MLPDDRGRDRIHLIVTIGVRAHHIHQRPGQLTSWPRSLGLATAGLVRCTSPIEVTALPALRLLAAATLSAPCGMGSETERLGE